MRSLRIFALLATLAVAQTPPPGTFPTREPESEVRLPNGKLQRDEILKAEFDKSLQDAAEMVKLSEELRADLQKSTAFVVSVQTIKKTDEIEKLARRIRGRLKRS